MKPLACEIAPGQLLTQNQFDRQFRITAHVALVLLRQLGHLNGQVASVMEATGNAKVDLAPVE